MNKHKFLNNKGMSLSEVLLATLLVGLVSLLLVTGSGLAYKEYKKSIQLSQSQELYATLQSLITNELRYTNNITLKNNNEVDTFFSVTYALKNADTSLYTLDENGDVTDDFGQLAIGDDESSSFNRLLGSASYTNNLGAKAFITYDKDKSLFTVNLIIGVIDGDSIIDKSFDVRVLNSLTIKENS